MSWFRRKISLVPSIKIIVLSALLAPATLIITHIATKIHTLRPHWQMSYFFKIAQRGKISQKGRKTNSIFLRFHVGVKWRNLIGSVWLGYRKTPAIYHVKCHRRLLSSFWRNHGYFPWQIYPGAVPSHAAPQFSVVKWSFTTVKVSRATAPIVKLLLKKNLQNNEACTNTV